MTLSIVHIQRGRGKGRHPWRIREFLAEHGLNMAAVARIAGTDARAVQDTVKGIRNDSRVLTVLTQLGCPESYLYGDFLDAAPLSE